MKAQQRMEVSSGIDLGRRALAAAAGVALLWAGFDERAALLAYVVSSALAALVYGGLLHRQRVRPRFGASGRRWRSTLAEALPFAVTGVVALLYRRLDLLMLSAWRGDVAAGVYGAAYRLWETLGIVPSSLLDALFPELARRGSAATRQQLQPLIRRGRRWLLLLLLALIVPCWWLAPWLIDVLYGDVAGIAAAPGLFRLLLLALPFTYLYLLNGHVLYALGRQRRVSAWMVAVTALNAGLNALLIPRWGMWAAAGVALFSEVALFAALRGSVMMLSTNHREMDGAEV
jgi:O-antigen/teichoic acid export membrane protein